MSTNTLLIVVIVGLVAAGLVLASLKGVVKILLFAASIAGGVITYYWLSKYGYSYLAFVTDSPAGWMVRVLSIAGAIFVFAVFQHGLSWFSNMFSWEGRVPGLGGAKGALTTILMCFFLLWLISVGIFYFGSLSEIRRFRDIATDSSARQNIPYPARLKFKLEETQAGQFLGKLDPFHDAERLKLAKLIAYLASEPDSARRTAFTAHLAQYVPKVHKLSKLSTDKGIRSLMEQSDMASLLGDPKLTKLLSDDQIRGGLRTLDPDRLFGMAGGEKPLK